MSSLDLLTTAFRLPTDARFRVVGGEGVLLRQDARDVFAVNDVASRMIALCDGVRTLAAVVTVITEEFDVDRATAERDCVAFVADFVARGALVAVPGAGT
ncbi:MAG: PqqD family protein [Polyangiaceae bacterium]